MRSLLISLDKVNCSHYVPSMCSVFVFIASTPDNGHFETGLTTDLVHSIWQSREAAAANPHGDTCSKLVWFKAFDTEQEADAELARIARWPLAWQVRLIETENANYTNLWTTLSSQPIIKVSPHFDASLAETDRPYPVIRIAHTKAAPERDEVSLAPILIRRRAS